MNAWKRELLGVELGPSAGYLRKRFSEAVWESPITDHLDPDVWDSAVESLVQRLLIEAGVDW
jgi:hypothetical protein